MISYIASNSTANLIKSICQELNITILNQEVEEIYFLKYTLSISLLIDEYEKGIPAKINHSKISLINLVISMQNNCKINVNIHVYKNNIKNGTTNLILSKHLITLIILFLILLLRKLAIQKIKNHINIASSLVVNTSSKI